MSDSPSSDRPLWSLAPERGRAGRVDETLRRGLAASLAYLGDSGAVPPGPDWTAVDKRLAEGPVSPWVFGLYSKLVADLSNDREAEAAEAAVDLRAAVRRTAGDGVVAMDDADVPMSWWDHYRVLLDTDPRRPFHPVAPAADAYEACARTVAEAFAVLKEGDPDAHEEIGALLRTIVLAAPDDPAAVETFNGASTFFMWGATLLNAARSRGLASTIDVLVHEASHMLLFGASADDGLTTNPGDERYASPLRSDGRPVDGIFHACYVATRVHVVVDRLLESGSLPAGERDVFADRRDRNGAAARASLETLNLHARPTQTGEAILDTLRLHWAAVAPA